MDRLLRGSTVGHPSNSWASCLLSRLVEQLAVQRSLILQVTTAAVSAGVSSAFRGELGAETRSLD